jgi:hypothetical protein
MNFWKGSLMAFSDLILRLGNQAKHLEETASALRTENDTELKARETELRDALAKVKSALDQNVEAGSAVASNRLADLRRTLSDGFEAIRTDVAAGGKDAEETIAFAVQALQEAEYYLLASVAVGDNADTDTDVQADAAPADAAPAAAAAPADAAPAAAAPAPADAAAQGASADVPVVEEVDAVVVTDGETTEVVAVESDVPADGSAANDSAAVGEATKADSNAATEVPATADNEPTK